MNETEKLDKILSILECKLRQEENINYTQGEIIRELKEQNQILLDVINNKVNS